jgi:hypothetical protein
MKCECPRECTGSGSKPRVAQVVDVTWRLTNCWDLPKFIWRSVAFLCIRRTYKSDDVIRVKKKWLHSSQRFFKRPNKSIFVLDSEPWRQNFERFSSVTCPCEPITFSYLCARSGKNLSVSHTAHFPSSFLTSATADTISFNLY